MPAVSTIRTELEIDDESFRVFGTRVEERLSTVGGFTVEIADDESAPPPASLVGKKAKLRISRVDGRATRTLSGVVTEARRQLDKDGHSSTEIVVRPRLFRLGLRSDCRIFQAMKAPDVVVQVLTEAGIPASNVVRKLSAAYEPRDYTVQYRETDLDFVLRLSAEEGIWIATTFDDEEDGVLLCDDGTGAGDIEDVTEIPFAATFGFDIADDRVMWVRRTHEVRSDKVTTRDYDFEHPKLDLDATVEGRDDGAHALEVYAWPGRYTKPAVGKRFAASLLDAMQAERDVVTGETTLLTMRPGLRFSIAEHPYAPLNQEYLITAVETETRELRSFHGGKTAEGRDYVCRFTAVPTKTTTYRPARRPREQSIPGVQSAIVTGPSGSEVHTDAHGRVKASFFWDRSGKTDDTSSTWMRTSQLQTGGSMLLPRAGWEVAVRHVEGDADRPMIMGRLYNAVTPPPYALPAGKARGSLQTATTPGGGSANEIRTDDTGGNEELFFNASKDMTIDVVHNVTETIGNNETVSIGSNHTLHVTNSITASVGATQTITVGANQTVNVETFKVDQVGGDFSLTIGGNRSMHVGGDHKQDIGGDASVTVGTLKADLVVGSVNESTTGDFTHDVGAALIEMTAKSRAVTGAAACSETTGALKAIITKGGRGVEVGGSMTQKVAGAIVTKIDGDRSDTSGAGFNEIAAGAQILKADNITFEGESVVSVVMGASTITLTPASISLAGVSLKIDGATAETAALILDN